MSPQYPILNNRPLDHWKVAELKEELKKRKLVTRGLKEDLIKRLHDSINEEIDALKKQELANGSGQKHDQNEVPTDPIAEEPMKESKTNSETVDFITDSTTSGNDEKKTTCNADEVVETPDLSVVVGEVTTAVVMVSDVVANDSLHMGVVTTGQDSIPDEKSLKTEKAVDEKITKGNSKKDDDLQPISKDVNLEESEQNVQVSEVKPDLGFHVNCESNSIVPINEKNELKDNLNADNFHLELEIVKPEILHSSSSDVAPVGGVFQSLDKVPDPSDNQLPLQTTEDVATVSYEDISKKNDSVGGRDPEKLNLDRSSGDESMEEDVSESKQIDSNSNQEVVQERIDIEELEVEEPSKTIRESGLLFPTSKDAVIEEENKPFISSEKRKLEEKEPLETNEPSKRQRRWSIQPQKLPEQEIATFSLTQSELGQSTPRRTITRSDSNVSGDAPKERTVPPSQKPPTNSLRIDHFLRPFTLKAVHELLAKTGSVCSFWMDNIKTHCYVTYSSEEDAIQTRNAVYNLQWPPNGGRLLLAEFVDPQEVKNRFEAPPESTIPIIPAAAPTSARQNQQSQHASRQHGLKELQQQSSPALPPPPPPPPPPLSDIPSAKERLQHPPLSKEPEPPILTLDDLFMKTKTTPRIYYLPLPEVQVSAKKRTKK